MTACAQCLAWGHPCWLGTGDVQGGSNSSLAPAKHKSFDFCYLLARRCPWAPSVLAWRIPPATPKLVAIYPFPKWDVVLPALLWGFPKGICAWSWSRSLCPHGGCPDWGSWSSSSLAC